MIKVEIEEKKRELSWTPEQLKYIDSLKNKGNKKFPKSILIELLYFAQDEFDGWISEDVMQLVATTLNIPLINVEELVNFYSMFNTEPVGMYHIKVCSGCSCSLNKSEKILKIIRERTQTRTKGKKSKTSKDGLFTVTEVSCLGACIKSPAITVNNEYHEKVTEDYIILLVEKLKREAAKNGL